ncbi:MAG: biotin--[acetyl-CoA-carboxylase] ligase [Deltaproteobacteria bacterium]|nr:MAG: biotin--[acetyl-CoA-carboxylase] ligase [Deltaproteobacteria bacterium]
MINMDSLQPHIILDKLGTSLFAQNIIFQRSLDSTNTIAKELAAQGAPEGTLVLAEEQRAGKGRMGRRWVSPGYVNLLFSLLMRPKIHKDQVFVTTMILALATIEAIRSRTGLTPTIKWPNDLFVAGKKLGGILTEFSMSHDDIDYVVLGLGLNVNWSPDQREEVSHPATSILAETGSKISRNELLVSILMTFEMYYRQVLSGHIDDFYRTWNEASMIIGRNVEIVSPKEKTHGKALRIDRNGALVIQDNAGKERKIISGDVSISLPHRSKSLKPC